MNQAFTVCTGDLLVAVGLSEVLAVEASRAG
jgi:hypothetical protein